MVLVGGFAVLVVIARRYDEAICCKLGRLLRKLAMVANAS